MLITRIILKLIRIMESFVNRHRLKYFVWECKHVGVNPQITFPCSTNELENVTIGDNFKMGKNGKIRTFSKWGDVIYHPNIIIGNNVDFEDWISIAAIDSIVIEDNVLAASFVYISDLFHGTIDRESMDISPIKRPLYAKGPIHICRNVWLGEHVCVMPNVTIGEGSIVGANSVVTKDIPPYSVAVGSPAKVIRTLK